MDSSTFHEKFNHLFSAISFFESRATKEAVAEFKLQTDFLFRHSFGDNEGDEINHLRFMIDRVQIDSSLPDFQRCAGTVRYRLFLSATFAPESTDSLAYIAALADKRAGLIKSLEDLHTNMATYKKIKDEHPRLMSLFYAERQRCHPMKLKELDENAPCAPSLATCRHALHKIFDSWICDFDSQQSPVPSESNSSVSASLVESPSPALAAVPSIVAPGSKSSLSKSKPNTISVVVHRHVHSFKPAFSSKSRPLPSSLPSSVSTRVSSPVPDSAPSRSSAGILPTPASATFRSSSPDGILPTPSMRSPAESISISFPSLRTRAAYPRYPRSVSPPAPYAPSSTNPQYLAQLLVPYLATLLSPCVPTFASSCAPLPAPRYAHYPSPPITV